MYEELVKALRCKGLHYEDCEKQGCKYIKNGWCDYYRLNIEAADAIEELSKPRWIPVTERLPGNDAVCILTNGVSNAIGYRGKVFGWHLIYTDYLEASDITHWMPLPEPPKEET